MWYNFPAISSSSSSSNNNDEDCKALKRGVVESVAYDFESKAMVYGVMYKDQNVNYLRDGKEDAIREDVPEHMLAYASGCTVFINVEGDEVQDETKMCKGTVLMSKPSPTNTGKFVYTVVISMDGSKSRYEVGVEGERIKYRELEEASTDARIVLEEKLPVAKSQSPEQPSSNKDTQRGSPTSVLESLDPNLEAVPKSITCGDRVDELDKFGRMKRSGNGVSEMPDTSVEAVKKTLSHNENGGFGGQGSISIMEHCVRMDINVPSWLQRNRNEQKRLFCHLVFQHRPNKRTHLYLSEILEEERIALSE